MEGEKDRILLECKISLIDFILGVWVYFISVIVSNWWTQFCLIDIIFFMFYLHEYHIKFGTEWKKNWKYQFSSIESPHESTKTLYFPYFLSQFSKNIHPKFPSRTQMHPKRANRTWKTEHHRIIPCKGKCKIINPGRCSGPSSSANVTQ